MTYTSIIDVITNISRFIGETDFNSLNDATAIESYNRFYEPIELWTQDSDDKEPSIFTMELAVRNILSPYSKIVKPVYEAVMQYLHDLLLYRLLYLVNEQSVTRGKYDKLMISIKDGVLKIYDFKEVDIDFDSIKTIGDE